MILSWFGRVFDFGRERESTPYWPMILYARRMVRRGQSYAVDSKHSIDLKTQFVTHVLIRYSVPPRPSFINKWFCRGFDVSLSWGESGNLLRIDQWFCLLEGLSEEDRAMLSIQSVQLTWKLNLSPTCWSGTPFCWGLHLSTNDFVVVWIFHQVGERAGIHSVHSVVEDAVEQNSWGMSGSDWMCCFQNNGGLHRTSRDAPPETHDVGERAGIHSVRASLIIITIHKKKLIYF